MPCLSNKFTRVTELPMDPEKIEIGWLSAALDAEVESFETRVCSEGQVAITVVLHDIVYANPTEAYDRPQSVAVKMHPAAAESRSFGAQGKFFSKELYFYTEFKDFLVAAGVEAPETYGIWTDGGVPGRDVIEFFVLMMEDLTQRYEPYSVKNSPSVADVENIAINSMLPMHVTFWNKLDLEKFPVLDPGNSLLEDFLPMMEGYAEAWPKVKAQWPSRAGFSGPLAASGFPVSWKRGLDLLDKLARPGATRSFYDKCANVWRSRVKTCVHGPSRTDQQHPAAPRHAQIPPHCPLSTVTPPVFLVAMFCVGGGGARCPSSLLLSIYAPRPEPVDPSSSSSSCVWLGFLRPAAQEISTRGTSGGARRTRASTWWPTGR
jgi:hypothetical protein